MSEVVSQETENSTPRRTRKTRPRPELEGHKFGSCQTEWTRKVVPVMLDDDSNTVVANLVMTPETGWQSGRIRYMLW